MNCESPCVNICQVDSSGNNCAGCFRSLDEIARWRDMADDEKMRVLESLPGRKTKTVVAHSIPIISSLARA